MPRYAAGWPPDPVSSMSMTAQPKQRTTSPIDATTACLVPAIDGEMIQAPAMTGSKGIAARRHNRTLQLRLVVGRIPTTTTDLVKSCRAATRRMGREMAGLARHKQHYRAFSHSLTASPNSSQQALVNITTKTASKSGSHHARAGFNAVIRVGRRLTSITST